MPAAAIIATEHVPPRHRPERGAPARRRPALRLLQGIRPDITAAIRQSILMEHWLNAGATNDIEAIDPGQRMPVQSRAMASWIAQAGRLLDGSLPHRCWALWREAHQPVGACPLVRVHLGVDLIRVDIEDRTHPNFEAFGWHRCLLPRRTLMPLSNGGFWLQPLDASHDLPGPDTPVLQARCALLERGGLAADQARDQAIRQGLLLIERQAEFTRWTQAESPHG